VGRASQNQQETVAEEVPAAEVQRPWETVAEEEVPAAEVRYPWRAEGGARCQPATTIPMGPEVPAVAAEEKRVPAVEERIRATEEEAPGPLFHQRCMDCRAPETRTR
jgi:hypothetical protein